MPSALRGRFKMNRMKPSRQARQMKHMGMPAKDLMVLTPSIPPSTTNTAATTAKTVPQNSFIQMGASVFSLESSMHMPASVTAMESHWVTREIVMITSMTILAIVLSGSTSNNASVSASAPWVL